MDDGWRMGGGEVEDDGGVIGINENGVNESTLRHTHSHLLNGFHSLCSTVVWIVVSSICCDRSQSTQCRSVCRSLFIEDSTPSEAQRNALERLCGNRITQCVRNHTRDTPVHNPAESK